MNLAAWHSRWVSMFSVAAGALVILMFGLVPTLTSYFRATGIPLPMPTRIVMGLSALLTTYWWASVPLGFAFFFGVIRLSKAVGSHDQEVRAVREAVLVRWEPMLIVGLSIVVGGLILAMFLPMWDAVQAMG
jgi:type II secretory pathway component PulF